MKITGVPLRENFMAIYKWLSEHPLDEKKNWPGYGTLLKYKAYRHLRYPEHFVEHACFACQAVPFLPQSKALDCNKCPVKWYSGPLNMLGAHCITPNSSYLRWIGTTDAISRSYWAKIISESWE